MKKKILAGSLCLCLVSSVVWADVFGTGANQFTIDFVNISKATNPTSGIPAGSGFTFTGVDKDYRMGTYEITNEQWFRFEANIAPMKVKGYPSQAYDNYTVSRGSNVPTNMVSWYEAAQFVNWLNTSSGKTAAYKFTGTQGTSDYTLGVWSASDAGYNAANPYRNSNAIYFLPTENEWVKAAYWNGSALQTYATKAGESLYQGNGSNGGWNYYIKDSATNLDAPWAVGSGSQELNGTYDMMGNVREWMESPYNTGDYTSGAYRSNRGASYGYGSFGALPSSVRSAYDPGFEHSVIGFRVASVPEPCSLTLLFLGGLALRYRKR
jgi:formylglycine-generating enzyme required for sulfatase activity